MKSSSKRKRTRQELENVKQEEEELKSDKQLFLQMVKRLKEEKTELEEQIEQISQQMLPQSTTTSFVGSKQRPGDFNI